MPNKDYVLKTDGLPNPVPVAGSGGAASVLTAPFVTDFNMQGHSSVIVQLSYTYGAATGLNFAFTEYDPDFPAPGSDLYSIDVGTNTAKKFGPIVSAYPTLASGSGRWVFPISGNNIRMTITGIGTPTSGDTITLMSITPAVFV